MSEFLTHLKYKHISIWYKQLYGKKITGDMKMAGLFELVREGAGIKRPGVRPIWCQEKERKKKVNGSVDGNNSYHQNKRG